MPLQSLLCTYLPIQLVLLAPLDPHRIWLVHFRLYIVSRDCRENMNIYRKQTRASSDHNLVALQPRGKYLPSCILPVANVSLAPVRGCSEWHASGACAIWLCNSHLVSDRTPVSFEPFMAAERLEINPISKVVRYWGIDEAQSRASLLGRKVILHSIFRECILWVYSDVTSLLNWNVSNISRMWSTPRVPLGFQ